MELVDSVAALGRDEAIDLNARAGVLTQGSIEWMRASNGVWHTGQPEEGRVRAVQLWVALPPDVPAFEAYYDAKTVWPAESLARRKALFG